MIFNKILVAIDDSPQASIVFTKALDLAQTERSKLMVFHCINSDTKVEDKPFLGIATVGDVDLYGTFARHQKKRLQQEIAKVENKLENYYQQANFKQIPIELAHKIGVPGKQICQQAQTWGANLIIIGRRGHNQLAEIVLGSVSNYVIHHAPCSVLVIQETNQETNN
ncbi:MAG: universal stress protein [Nostocaceae cyanobacterium]|nr:universal stress protein [Nostocaceae cyanobacterium]